MMVVWRYEIEPDYREAFIGHYGPAGSWASLFGKATGYLGTELYADRERPTRFLTIDRWRSAEDRARFVQAYGAEYDALDKICEAFTREEQALGEYLAIESVDAGIRVR